MSAKIKEGHEDSQREIKEEELGGRGEEGDDGGGRSIKSSIAVARALLISQKKGEGAGTIL